MTGPVRWPGLAASACVLALGVLFLIWAQGYAPRTREVPVLAAWLTIALALIDAAAQFETPWGRLVRRFVTARNVIAWKPSGEAGGWDRAAASVLSVLGYVAALVMFGVYIATPAYVVFYMVLYGRKSPRQAVVAAVALTLALWLVFDLGFRYTLYNGMIFGAV